MEELPTAVKSRNCLHRKHVKQARPISWKILETRSYRFTHCSALMKPGVDQLVEESGLNSWKCLAHALHPGNARHHPPVFWRSNS